MKKQLLSQVSVCGIIGIILSVSCFAKAQCPGYKSIQGVLSEPCMPPKGYIDLDINNVRARINVGGDMWWDWMCNSHYEVPKGSGKHSLHIGALWVAGLNQNGQIKTATQYLDPTKKSFFAGPLTTDGATSVDTETCLKYDRLYKITKSDVNRFITNHYNPDPDYIRPDIINEWPAHGDISLGHDYNLAPYFDKNGDGRYNPDDGDYPFFVYPGTATNSSDYKNALRGDMSIWWVFNDKGDISNNNKNIGIEVRAQAFAYATTDELNNVTFYDYQIINRSTNTLYDTYFGFWTDITLGNPYDNYIGCDVNRGLGYAYNALDIDGYGSSETYGAFPPAVGVTILQGPYMDPDGKDNPAGIDHGINGSNFSDGIIDNECYGMRHFITLRSYSYTALTSDDFYRLLKGVWNDNSPLWYGGDGHQSHVNSCGPQAAFIYPGNSDPLYWGTNYIIPTCYQGTWTEANVNNNVHIPGYRNFLQSSGPFTMEPGSVNHLTIAVPWARAITGGAQASLELLKTVSDKCQAIFDQKFCIVDGPSAPDLTIQELDRELILYLGNSLISNNYNEGYKQRDLTIAPSPTSEAFDDTIRFQGYQIFQVRNKNVGVNDIHNPDLARQVAQCDIIDGVGRIINRYYDHLLDDIVPVEEVNGEDKGIRHSFQILFDMFAEGSDKRLVNHKKYYYLAIAYGYNNYKTYNPHDPLTHDGQKQPYKLGSTCKYGRDIIPVAAIPHLPAPQYGGTVIQASYGYSPKITRIEGQGNGGLILDLTPETEQSIIASSLSQNPIRHITYKNNRGPVDVKVIDPFKIPDANFRLQFVIADSVSNPKLADMSYTYPISASETRSVYVKIAWKLTNLTNGKVYYSDKNIGVYNEQIIPEIGLSITLHQVALPGDTINNNTLFDPIYNGFMESSIQYANPLKQWLGGVKDNDSHTPYNWIRSGQYISTTSPFFDYYHYAISQLSPFFIDPNESYENIVGGYWAPYRLAAHDNVTTNPSIPFIDGIAFNTIPGTTQHYHRFADITKLHSIDLVFTPDKNKWSRCPVVEMQYDKTLSDGNSSKFLLRNASSKDINGNTVPNCYGMGWFPGYAINVETGERLNIMFGEDSWLKADNGADMLFNPSNRYYDGVGLNAVFGGKHVVYVFGHSGIIPAYDKGERIFSLLDSAAKIDPSLALQKGTAISNVYKEIMWCGIPMPASGHENDWLSTEVRIRIRVKRPYMQNYSAVGSNSPQNLNLPMYEFSTSDIAPLFDNRETAKNALELINVVPNPYYAYSAYETGGNDNRIKITNLPRKCVISIYSLNGNLVRRFDVDKTDIVSPRSRNSTEDALTSIDWDLRNNSGSIIAGGFYLIHVNAEGIGERVLKWYGHTRKPDGNVK